MHPSTPAPLITLLIAAIGITACDSSSDDTPNSAASVVWENCASNERLECATLQVPTLHNDTTSEKIAIALNRIPATGNDPIGSLLFNPGGPGGSGLQMIEDIAEGDIIPDSIRDSYHLVGFDPRGVGKSTPIVCDSPVLEDLNEYILNRTETEELFADLKTISDTCLEKYGSYLQQVGSAAVVRDMELIRVALDEPTLNFLGYSYGTRLAALYAQNYPTTTGRMILDGSLPPTHSVAMLFGDELTVMESNFVRLAETCQRFTECTPADYQQKLVDRIKTLIDENSQIELELLAALLIIAVQEPAILDNVAEPLFVYSQNWDVTPLLVLLDTLEGEDMSEDADESEEDGDEESAIMAIAVSCADDADRPDIDSIEALRDQFNAASDLFGELQLASAAACAHWPEAIDPLPPISTNQAPETLVIGGPTDAQTIEEWSQQMAAAIGGRYLRSEHEGHTVVFSAQNSCTDEAAISFLLTGQLPAVSVCSIDN